MFWLGTQLPQVTKINELWKKLSNTAASLKCLHFFFGFEATVHHIHFILVFVWQNM